MPIEGGTGAAGANNVRAGGAYYEVVGKDGVSPILTKIETRVKGFRGFMQRAGTAIFAPGAGVLGAGVAGAVVGAFRLFEDLEGSVRKYNRELERSAELMGEITKARARISAREGERISSILDPGEQADALRERIGQLNKDLEGTTKQANAARGELDDLSKIFDTSKNASVGRKLFNLIPGANAITGAENIADRLLGSHDTFVSQAQSQLDSAKGSSASLREELAKLQHDLLMITDPSKNFGLNAELKKTVRDLQQQQRLAFMSPEHQAMEKQLEELERRRASPEALNRIREESRQLEEQRKSIAFLEDHHELLNRLSGDVKFKGLDSNERAVAEMMDRARLEGRAFDTAPFQERINRLNRAANEIKVSTRGSVQTLGYGDTAMKMLTIQEKIAQNTEPDRLGQALASELRLR